MVFNSSTTYYLPEYIVEEILSRLPVKSLLRFKCVCKSWCFLISSPDFISMHFQNYASPSFLLVDYTITRPERKFISFLSQTTNEKVSLVNQNLPTLVKTKENYRICEPCNGLICFYRHQDEIVLWNPATKEFKQLPQPGTSDRRKVLSIRVGFSYDAKNNDYKILQVLVFHGFYLEFELYSLRSNAWKTLEPNNCMFDRRIPLGIDTSLVHGNKTILFWLDSDIKRDILEISCFDMSDEKFDIIQLPSAITETQPWNFSGLFKFRESISFICCPEQIQTSCEIWVNENLFASRSNCSWIKLFSIKAADINSSSVNLIPLRIFYNGRVLFVNDSGIILYDPIAKKSNILEHHEDIRTEKIFNYRESLVALSEASRTTTLMDFDSDDDDGEIWS